MASEPAPDPPGVPLLSDLARNDEERAMFTFIQTNLADRALAARPGVPEDRLAALGKGYQATLRDENLLSEAKKHKFDIHPIPGERIQKHVAEMMSMSQARVKKLAQAMGLKM
jgi:hypothetical protein